MHGSPLTKATLKNNSSTHSLWTQHTWNNCPLICIHAYRSMTDSGRTPFIISSSKRVPQTLIEKKYWHCITTYSSIPLEIEDSDSKDLLKLQNFYHTGVSGNNNTTIARIELDNKKIAISIHLVKYHLLPTILFFYMRTKLLL